MRIDRIACETTGDRTRVSARLAWEDCQRDEETVWYEWPASFRGDVFPAPAAVFVAALPLAMVNGERRVAMEAPVCAFLYDHLRDVTELFGTWYPSLVPPKLDVPRQVGAPPPSAGRRAALCLSGGVDSLAALAENQAALAPAHPERFRDAFFLFGLNTYDFEAGAPVAPRVAWYREYARRLDAFCARSGLTLVPISTNVRSLYSDWHSWFSVGEASALTAAAHAMPGRVHALTIASAGLGPSLTDSGTDPLLDPLFSSYLLDVRSVQATVSRLGKIQLFAKNADALAVLRVCYTFEVPSAGAGEEALAAATINCGRCEKCLRTMLSLLACDALGRAPTFPTHDVKPEMLEGLKIGVTDQRQVPFYRTLADLLLQRGRGDLARAIVKQLDERESDLGRASGTRFKRLFRRSHP